jgi:serine/threonine protein kinase/Tol biopolymer transport system component
MTDERWQRVADLYQSAQDRPAAERSSFVKQAADGDSDLVRQVELLLAEDDRTLPIDAPIAAAPHSLLADNSGVQLGSSLGPYRIDSLLGVGGMGEVYRARDTKLNRDVAIKILPSAFANDPDRLARFKREAQVLASLNHPNVGGIYGFEDANGFHALIIELVDGPTLAERLQASGSGLRGSGLPLDEALAIARQIADALEVAHEQGIIHRDLKPANIKVREDGTVKVLDFGLAKLTDPVGAALEGGPSMTQSPTITTPAMTAAGIILGTAAYMSPEQAKGRPADKRSDIWAFGCVLYEMLTGKRAFDGEDVSDTLANVLKTDPDWSALPDAAPGSIRRVLRRCLTKDRKSRLADIADARFELADREDSPPSVQAAPGRSSHRERMVWAVSLLVVAVGTALLVRGQRREVAETVHVELTTPPTDRPESIAMSPDGRAVVVVGESGGRSQLWLRDLNAERPRALAGTEGALYPFWSPDSRSIGFFADGKLRRLDLDTSSVRPLTSAAHASNFGGTWNRQGTIVFSTGPGPVQSVSEEGGALHTVLPANKPRGAYFAPYFLPDGEHFLVRSTLSSDNATGELLICDLKGTAPRHLLNADSSAILVSGNLLFVQGGTLYSQPFDLDRLALSGTATAVSGEPLVIGGGGTGIAALSASSTGRVVFRSAEQAGRRQFTWFDRVGTVRGVVGDIDSKEALNPELSPDGRRLAYNRRIDTNTDVWVLDVARGTKKPLTSYPGLDHQPVWSPDGTHMVFSSIRSTSFDHSNRSSNYDLYEISVDAAEPEMLVRAEPPGLKVASDWSRDDFVLYRTLNPDTGYDVWAVSMRGDRKAFPVVATPANERDAQFSPDGKWIAYESDQSGPSEIYIQAFPKAARVFGPVSKGGGVQPRWRSDGKELYYISPDRHLTAVKVNTDAAAGTVDFEPPSPLFVAPVSIEPSRQQYVVAKDGQKFLLNVELDRDRPYPMTLILNWKGVTKP